MALDKDLKEIIDVVAEGVSTGIKQLADGFQYPDLFAIIPVLSKIPEAIKDADNALHYLKDMDEQKENEIVDGVVTKLGDASESVRIGARRILRLLAEGYMTGVFFANLKPNAAVPPVEPSK